jgi:hypothetical protein
MFRNVARLSAVVTGMVSPFAGFLDCFFDWFLTRE